MVNKEKFIVIYEEDDGSHYYVLFPITSTLKEVLEFQKDYGFKKVYSIRKIFFAMGIGLEETTDGKIKWEVKANLIPLYSAVNGDRREIIIGSGEDKYEDAVLKANRSIENFKLRGEVKEFISYAPIKIYRGSTIIVEEK